MELLWTQISIITEVDTNIHLKPGVVVVLTNPRTREVKAVGSR